MLRQAYDIDTRTAAEARRFEQLLEQARATDSRFQFGIDIVFHVFNSRAVTVAKIGLERILGLNPRKIRKRKGGRTGKNYIKVRV
ncbi:hypothetical protein TrRE_jg4556 [Triparma retinervis]|uniref:Uncharacterized protein n=1 Tax=Triparma retinervis TaxID=2557542 RepID=A0A9W7L6K0_9STRA|nr:hypothetical protein TrRE_jg4556 [Triparma retinervis]